MWIFDLLPEGMLLYKSYETLGLVVIQINCYLMTISSQQGKFRILSKKNVFIKITWWNFPKLDDFVLEILLIECYAMQNLLTWIQNYKTPVGQLLDYLECSTYYQLILCRTVCTDKTLLSVQTTRYPAESEEEKYRHNPDRNMELEGRILELLWL